jgi:acetyl-CoA carboxylase biotin carboxyl carrier protein
MTGQAMDEARQLSEWLSGTDIGLLELSGPGKLIRLRRTGVGYSACAAVPPPAASESPARTATVVRAGSVGIVLHAHPLREETLVRPGQPVAAGQTLVLLKIGAVLLAVPAPRAGVVSRVIATNESVVGFGEPLVELE